MRLPHALLLLLWSQLCTCELPIPASQRLLARQYTPLSDLHELAALSSSVKGVDALAFNDSSSLLSQILIPRSPGTANLKKVQQLIKDRFKAIGGSWELEEDCFVATTPIGEKPMCNLAFHHDPEAERRFVVAAHIDSKWFPNSPDDQFVGATDSAASVALMVDLAERLTPWLETKTDAHATLTLLFLDGEEAFQTWTATDSIYGARHLAEKWEQPYRSPSAASGINTNLQRITTFVLLDLIGAPNPSIQNFYHQTGWLYDRFYHAEKRLQESSLLWTGVPLEQVVGKGSIFRDRENTGGMWYGRIEDDHIPFVKRGVPVLHLIAVPFPSVWHTLKDDASALDFATLKAWSMILRTVCAEYLALGPPAKAAKTELRQRGLSVDVRCLFYSTPTCSERPCANLEMKLYGERVSNYTQRVLLIAAELEIDLRLVEITWDEFKSPAHLARQPFGRVPVLELDNGSTIYESRAIARYLCRHYGGVEKGLIPSPDDDDAVNSFETMASVEVANFDSWIFPVNSHHIWGPRPTVPTNQAVVGYFLDVGQQHLDVYDKLLAQRPYLTGDSPCMIDLWHVPPAVKFRKAGLGHILDERPHVEKWLDKLIARPSWQKLQNFIAGA